MVERNASLIEPSPSPNSDKTSSSSRTLRCRRVETVFTRNFPGTARATRGQSPLVRSVRPFLDVDVDAGLFVEPIIMRLPLLARVHKADVEEPDDLRDQLVDLTQRDLRNT